MQFTLFTSAFCEPCTHTRAVLAEATRLVPECTVVEIDVAGDPEQAEALLIRNTPTVVITNTAGEEVFRATGVPTLAQVLVAAAKAL